jgi:hypothetical protein
MDRRADGVLRWGCKSSACPLAGRHHAKALGRVVDHYVVACELFQAQEVVGASFLGQAFCFVEGRSVLFLLWVSLVGIGGISWLRGGDSCVHIHFFGNGGLWFRSYSGSLLANAPKVTKRSLPHHSVPRLGSACPHSGPRNIHGPARLNRHPCRFTRSTVPTCGHRG